MKKLLIIFLILPLILFTAFIKNSTKRIDDQIYVLKENIRILEKDYEKNKLENDYLSSSEKLLQFQKLYFVDELFKKEIQEIGILKRKNNKFYIEKLEIIKD
tara:strand:+ start:262 stop:567 length:306 start_codon:yes stop_codon:yes gene_type:complete